MTVPQEVRLARHAGELDDDGHHDLADITDVDLTGVTTADVLTFDGTNWIAASPAGPSGAAGGDLSGTYPNPSVVNDSHSHTAATLPAAVVALDDLTDVVITTPAAGQRLRYNGSAWVNSTLHWQPMVDYTGLVMLDSGGNPSEHEVT